MSAPVTPVFPVMSMAMARTRRACEFIDPQL